ncbi:TetR/AcrR family transcriptional regulator [Paenibacillus dakarensis]|uniref:TetR/AcrR family transcriptional regulator n=1 Tax=Paenibacillus dakarensis TaxID=1527293 RepID=UPI0006D56031|nr:TetR/AcrR family transcriptional regulator [Paenibacillus dakarensis]
MKKYTEEGSDYIRAVIGGAVFALLENTNYDAIKVVDIYRKAAVGKTTFYRYFGNKDGKKDAMFFNLKEGFLEFCRNHPELEQIDDRFGGYIWEEKEKMKLLSRENCMDVLDKLILSVYGPKDDQNDNIYFHYMGAGLWMGLIRAVIQNDFCDEPQVIREKLAIGFTQLFQNQTPHN